MECDGRNGGLVGGRWVVGDSCVCAFFYGGGGDGGWVVEVEGGEKEGEGGWSERCGLVGGWMDRGDRWVRKGG